ncbi:hypothetical protein [Rhodococcus ruber]
MTHETADSWFTFLGVVATIAATVEVVSAVAAVLILGALFLSQWVRGR